MRARLLETHGAAGRHHRRAARKGGFAQLLVLAAFSVAFISFPFIGSDISSVAFISFPFLVICQRNHVRSSLPKTRSAQRPAISPRSLGQNTYVLLETRLCNFVKLGLNNLPVLA